MKTELYRAIKSININELSPEDNRELLAFFKITKNDLIRNQIAFIFSDIKYNESIPSIIRKINDKSLYNKSIYNKLIYK